MPITEYERNQLFNWFEENMGKERADALMSLLPPVGWADVATKRDLDMVDRTIDHVAERLDAKIDRVAERLDMRIDGLEARMDARFDAIDARFAAGDEKFATMAALHELRSDLQRTFVTWLFASQAAVIAAVAAMFALFR